jgi:hypothetical protein
MIFAGRAPDFLVCENGLKQCFLPFCEDRSESRIDSGLES